MVKKGMVILLSIANLVLNAQDDDYVRPQSSVNNKINIYNEWLPGYIGFKNNSVPLKGYLNLKTSSIGYIKKVCFRRDVNEKNGTLKFGGWKIPKDSLAYFIVAGHRFEYISYTDKDIPQSFFSRPNNSVNDWLELIEKGSINIDRGFSASSSYNGGQMVATGGGGMMVGGSSVTYIPVYYLKKGNSPAVLISAPELSIFRSNNYMTYKINERNKTHFINYISDNISLVEKVKNKVLLFGDIETYVHEYNQSFKQIDTTEKTLPEQKKETEYDNAIIPAKPEANPHNGFQASVFMGGESGNLSGHVSGAGKLIAYRDGINMAMSLHLGYVKNKMAFGFALGYTSMWINYYTINDSLYKGGIESVENYLTGIYVKKYFMPINIFLSAEAGMGHFTFWGPNLGFVKTNSGFAWKIKAGKEFFIGKRKKIGLGGYVSIGGLKCDGGPLISGFYSTLAPGMGAVISFN